jgi:hypothetical protein
MAIGFFLEELIPFFAVTAATSTKTGVRSFLPALILPAHVRLDLGLHLRSISIMRPTNFGFITCSSRDKMTRTLSDPKEAPDARRPEAVVHMS